MNIKKGDSVIVTKGKDRSKTGKVLRVFSSDDRVLIEGLNTFKKHTKPRRQGEKGEIVAINKPVPASNVMLFCSQCRRGVRIGYRVDGKKKTRFCRRCQTVIG